MEVTWKVLRAQLYCHVQRRFRHTDRRRGRWLKFHSRKTLITAPQGSQCQRRFVFDTSSITSQVIKRMVLYPSLFHIVTSQEICIKSATVLSEQRLSLNRPSLGIVPRSRQFWPHSPETVSGKNHDATFIIL